MQRWICRDCGRVFFVDKEDPYDKKYKIALILEHAFVHAKQRREESDLLKFKRKGIYLN